MCPDTMLRVAKICSFSKVNQKAPILLLNLVMAWLAWKRDDPNRSMGILGGCAIAKATQLLPIAALANGLTMSREMAIFQRPSQELC